ncbi:MAG: crosslink repair DNA glycosylase YcaQ family protein [Vicinamibacterales bacterium]
MTPTIAALRRYALARSLGAPASLGAAIERLGFVQADPIRAPARAQDLILRHRVRGYRAGDLETAYPALAVEEDFFVNYGFLPRDVQALMHPRRLGAWPRPGRAVGLRVLAFVRERGEAHPRDVDAHFAHGAVTNYWGGSSTATTHVLDHLHYRGHLRILRRDRGIRVYAPRAAAPAVEHAAGRRARVDALLDVLVALYAPVPSPTLAWLVNRLHVAAPQWRREIGDARTRAARRLAHATVDGVLWYWPAADDPAAAEPAGDRARLLAPFDPIVWDRKRFGRFWDWDYRFEAYTPAARRKYGYYALPLLWRERVVGWANLTVEDGRLATDLGFVGGRPRDRGFSRALDAELAAMARFLGVSPQAVPKRTA